MRHLLLIGSTAIALGACTSDPAITLHNPRSGLVATCDENHAVIMSQSANERCAREYERQGYVRGLPAPPS
jgi:hypothetical protein